MTSSALRTGETRRRVEDRSPLVVPEQQSWSTLSHANGLPRAFNIFLAKVCRVPTYPEDKCILGYIIWIITILFMLAYATVTICILIYDVKSENTKQTVTTGVFHAVLALFWSSLSLYGNHMARKLLSYRSFMSSLKLHSKTLFKIPATILISVLGIGVVAVTNYRSYHWDSDYCPKIHLTIWACRSSFIIMCVNSTIVLFFNLLVASAVLSICRTHTIGVRRFLRSLENDGKSCEAKYRQKFKKYQFAASHNLEELYLPEHCYENDDDDEFVDITNESLAYRPDYVNQIGEQLHTIGDRGPISDDTPSSACSDHVRSAEHSKPEGHSTLRPEVYILSKDDILFSFWKLASRMRMTSRSLQRWISSWLAFTILWLLRMVVSWLNSAPSYLEIALFILPLLMIIILCMSYAEANGEAARVVSSITPLQDRLEIIKSLPNIEFGMTLYNTSVNYSSIVTVVAALGLALSSRIILDEFLPPQPH